MDMVFDSEYAERYELWCGSASGQAYAAATNRLIDRVLDCERGWRILDVGCGLGLHMQHLKERGMAVHGVEAGPVMAKAAGRRLGTDGFVEVAEAHDLPFDDNTFDAVLLINSLEFMDRKAKVVAEAARVASSRICIITSNPFSPQFWWNRCRRDSHPLATAQAIAPWRIFRLIKDVLGMPPRNWSFAGSWPSLSWWPSAPYLGICVATRARFMTTPLTLSALGPKQAARPAAAHGRIGVLRRIK